MPFDRSLLAKGVIFTTSLIIAILVYSWINSPLIVTVTGVGRVSVPASTARFTLAVAQNDTSPVIATVNLRSRLDQLKNVLTENGIKPESIVESQIQITPAAALIPNATGFQASATLGAASTDIANLSTLIGSLYERGATIISQPILEVENQGKLEADAVKKALDDAKTQAGAIGKSHLKFIRKVAAVSQTPTPTSGTLSSKNQASATGENQTAETAANPNSLEIVKVVTVSYRMW